MTGSCPDFPRLDEVSRLVAQGLSDREVGDALGVSRETARRLRKRAALEPGSIARPWPDHGTAARYRRGCRCDECRGARTAEVIQGLRRRQAATADARRYGEPWSAEELATLARLGPARAARELDRTLFACMAQHRRLEAGDATA